MYMAEMPGSLKKTAIAVASRSQTTTRAPACAAAHARARPMPLAPPVTTITSPSASKRARISGPPCRAQRGFEIRETDARGGGDETAHGRHIEVAHAFA